MTFPRFAIRGLRRAVAAGLCAAVALCVALPAAAGVKQKSLYKGWQSPVGIALDAARDRVHFAWQAKDHTLHHAWLERGKKKDEVVDLQPGCDCGAWASIAVDSAGHPHIAYHAERTDPSVFPQVLAYAYHDGSEWHVENVAEGGYATAIALDGDDQPHIAYVGPGGLGLEYVHYDDGAWQHETVSGVFPFWATPLSLALDADGKAYVAYEDSATRRPYYATNADGDWTATELSSSTGPGGSVVVDALGHPHFALPLAGEGTVRYTRYDGAQWVSDDVYSASDVPAGIQNLPQSAALALAPGGRPHILFVTSFIGADRSVDAAFDAWFDGAEWRGILLKKKNASRTVALTSGPDGVVHGAYALTSKDLQKSAYVRLALSDLGGEWTSLAYTGTDGSAKVGGVLHVRNDGQDKSPSTKIAFYLSDDATLDAGDAPFSYRKKVGSIKAGLAKDVKVSFKTTAALAGKFVIAVLDPLHERDEGDRTDDAIAGALGP